MSKVLVVFNTCGASGRENTASYISSIESILAQNFNGLQVALSSCKNNTESIKHLKDAFLDRVTYNVIDDLVPVNISFNHTVRKNVEHFGEFEAYLYVDSGITFGSQFSVNESVVSDLYDLHKDKNCAMTSARTNTDAGTWLWHKEGENEQDESGQEVLFKDGDFKIPVGKTTNLHVQLFDNSIFKTFDKRLMPDIFASHCTESVFPFMCSALNKSFYIHKDVFLFHQTSMDGASSGFRPEYVQCKPWQHTFTLPHPETIDNIIKDPEMWDSGCGYEICQSIAPLNPDCYDENDKCKDPERLGRFILDNFYLKKEIYDYDKISADFVSF
jgi:hypothetical protein